MDFFAVTVKIAYKRVDAAFKVEGHFSFAAFIVELNGNSAGDKCHLAETLHQGIKAEIEAFFFEDLGIEFEGGGSTVSIRDRICQSA